jgi:hypothetical protein
MAQARFIQDRPVVTRRKMQTTSEIYLIPKNGIHTEKISLLVKKIYLF